MRCAEKKNAEMMYRAAPALIPLSLSLNMTTCHQSP